MLAPGSSAKQVNIRASDPFVLNFCRLMLMSFRKAASHRAVADQGRGCQAVLLDLLTPWQIFWINFVHAASDLTHVVLWCA